MQFCFSRFFKRLFGYDSGRFHLYHGTHTVTVPTCIRPSAVWVKVHGHGHGHDGCCQVPLNEIGYTIHCHRITFNVTVETHKCCVEWFAVS